MATPHIAYTDYSYTATGGYDLRYYDGSTGLIVTVDPPEAQYDISLALDANNHPHISYTSCVGGAAPCDLRYAHFNGSTWSTTTVEADVGRGTSLDLDSSGRPHIVYETFDGLKHVYFDGTSWVKEQVEYNAGYSPSLKLDANGNAHISFYSFACDYICLQYATNAPVSEPKRHGNDLERFIKHLLKEIGKIIR